MIKLLPLFLFILVTQISCLNHRNYIEPANGTIAKVIFHNTWKLDSSLIIYKDASTCKSRYFVDLYRYTNRLIKIDASKEFAFRISAAAGYNKLCGVTASFIPKPYHEYKIYYRYNDYIGQCYVNIGITKNGKLIAVKGRKRKWKNGFNEDSSFCDKDK